MFGGGGDWSWTCNDGGGGVGEHVNWRLLILFANFARMRKDDIQAVFSFLIDLN